VKFVLIDKLVRIEPGRSARAVKNLSLAEEYLADHFPSFPVLPGVLMLEAMVQTAAWVIRTAEDFAHSVIVLREARNVTYGNFVAPGNRMEVEVETVKLAPETAAFKAQCTMDGGNVARARLELARYNLADRNAAWADQDRILVEHWRAQLRLLGGLEALTAENPAN